MNVKIHVEVLSDQKSEVYANLDIEVGRYGSNDAEGRAYDRFLLQLAADLSERARTDAENFMLSRQAQKGRDI